MLKSAGIEYLWRGAWLDTRTKRRHSLVDERVGRGVVRSISHGVREAPRMMYRPDQRNSVTECTCCATGADGYREPEHHHEQKASVDKVEQATKQCQYQVQQMGSDGEVESNQLLELVGGKILEPLDIS